MKKCQVANFGHLYVEGFLSGRPLKTVAVDIRADIEGLSDSENSTNSHSKREMF